MSMLDDHKEQIILIAFALGAYGCYNTTLDVAGDYTKYILAGACALGAWVYYNNYYKPKDNKKSVQAPTGYEAPPVRRTLAPNRQEHVHQLMPHQIQQSAAFQKFMEAGQNKTPEEIANDIQLESRSQGQRKSVSSLQDLKV